MSTGISIYGTQCLREYRFMELNVYANLNVDIKSEIACIGAPFMIPIDTNLSPVHLRINPDKSNCFSVRLAATAVLESFRVLTLIIEISRLNLPSRPTTYY